MIDAPAFWRQDGPLSRALSPLAGVTAAATARRVARPGFRASVPVICCGNAGVGGSGKTPVALDLGARLLARGQRVAFLTRGHGGQVRRVLRVDPLRHEAALTGDEALLLARLAPTYVAANRAESARAAIAEGAQVLVMDDGLQNPSLAKDLCLLIVDGGAGFGNGRVLPAGPLREPAASAAARCQAAVLIGTDMRDVAADLAPLPVLRAGLRVENVPASALAFAGIGRPEKFFDALRAAGATLLETHAFADHHRFTASELRRLLARSDVLGVPVVTTEKDAMRLPAGMRERFMVVAAHLQWHDPAEPERLLDRWV